MFIIFCFLVLATLKSVESYMPNYIVVARQNSTNHAFIETIDGEFGSVKIPSTVDPSVFRWPYIQMTANNDQNLVYTLIIPDDGPTIIYKQTSQAYRLSVMETWTIDDDTIIFDLQSSSKKDTIFGIKVTGSYQRTLSNIMLEDDNVINITELYNLPEYWYVNASSYNNNNDVYYALINNFPGMNTSTLEQKLLVTDFSACTPGMADPKPSAIINTITSSSGEYLGQLQFISYDPEIRTLFGAGINLQSNIAYIVIIDPVTGFTTDPLVKISNVTEIGPLVTHSNHGTTGIPLNLFVKKGVEHWDLHYFQYNTNAKNINVDILTRSYVGPEYKYFVAAVRAFDEY